MGKHTVTLILNDEEYASLLGRVEYLQSQRPGSKVTKSDAIRQALSIQYSRTKKEAPVD